MALRGKKSSRQGCGYFWGRVSVRRVPLMLDRRLAQQFHDAETSDRAIAPVSRCFCDPRRCSFPLTRVRSRLATLADVHG